jgi:histidinol-phosphate aminotransferase
LEWQEFVGLMALVWPDRLVPVVSREGSKVRKGKKRRHRSKIPRALIAGFFAYHIAIRLHPLLILFVFPSSRETNGITSAAHSNSQLITRAPTAKARAMTQPEAKPWINAINAYTPGKAKGDDGRVLIKLSANENPLGCSEHATAALVEARTTLARYPDPASNALREALGAAYSLDPDQIVCGTGSDELLNLIAMGYAGAGDEIIYVRYGFSVYDIAARKCAATVVVAPDKDYGTDVDALLALVNARTRVVFVANPNNPTGTYADDGEIARLHAGLPADCVLVLDQAYGEYLDDDGAAAFDLARWHANVLITRTFSKIYGLAAERIGWAYGQPGLIATLNRIRAPFNVTAAGQSAAIAALADTEFVAHSRQHNSEWRDWMAGEIASLSNHGLTAIPSQANFLMVMFEGQCSAETAYKGLMDAGYIVRWLPGQGLANGLRITIGSEEENRGVMAALRGILGQHW